MTDEIERLRRVYATQYNPDPEDRNYQWHPLNPVSIYYRHAQERAITDLIRRLNLHLAENTVLDVGCGNGGTLRFMASLGIPPDQLSGIDLMDYRISAARQLAPPGMALLVGNAESLPYPTLSFDLLIQSTVFSSILDARLRQRIASEMLRVLKPGGHLLWYDLYRSRNASLHCLPLAEIKHLFPETKVLYQRSLHPIYATRILRIGRSITEIVENLPGMPKTHYLILLQKI